MKRQTEREKSEKKKYPTWRKGIGKGRGIGGEGERDPITITADLMSMSLCR